MKICRIFVILSSLFIYSGEALPHGDSGDIIHVKVPVVKALCYEGRKAAAVETENYYYYVNYSNSEILVTADLRDGHIEDLIERQTHIQKILDAMRELKKEYKDKKIKARWLQH